MSPSASPSPDGLRPTDIVPPLAAASGLELRVAATAPRGWISVAELAAPEGRGERHRRIARVAGPGAPPRLPLIWELEAVSWYVGALVAGSLVSGLGLPYPGPGSTWIRVGERGLADGLAIAAAAPCAEPRTEPARALITELAGPLIPADRRSARVLWWHVGDRIADAAIASGEVLAASDDGVRVATDLLAPGVPYSVPSASLRRSRFASVGLAASPGAAPPARPATACPRLRSRESSRASD